jgi:hypothetical protein
MKRYIALLIAFVFILSATSCARMPKTKTAERKISKFFQKYGKKYPDTIYGKLPVKSAEVTDMGEIHKNMVSADAYLMMGETDVKKINATLERRALRWRVVSWENVL